MSATARQVINDATRLIRRRPAGETLPADDAAECLRDLNTLLDSLNLGQWRKTPAADLALTDSVDIPNELIQPLTSMLAVKVASMYGIEVPPQVVADAVSGEAQMASFRFRGGTAVIDSGLLYTSAYRFSRGT